MAASHDAKMTGIIFYGRLITPIVILASLHYAPANIFIPFISSRLKSDDVKVNEYSS